MLTCLLTARHRSIHNVRIERLWVDVTAKVGAKWAEFFTRLELRHGLDINNPNHIWLLHHIFLGDINTELAFFAETWNQHKIQLRRGPNRSPADMFGFDMYVRGIRGDQLPEEELDEEELEVYGVDWAGLQEDNLVTSQLGNNSVREGSSSWVGRVGPPSDLNEVAVHPPPELLEREYILQLHAHLASYMTTSDYDTLSRRWRQALSFALSCNSEF